MYSLGEEIQMNCKFDEEVREAVSLTAGFSDEVMMAVMEARGYKSVFNTI